MKYNELRALIEHSKSNYERCYIKDIKPDIFNFSVKYDNTDVFDLFFYRLQQNPLYLIDDRYKKCFEKLYSMGNMLDTEEKEYVKELINTNFNSFFNLLEKKEYDKLNPEFPFFNAHLPSLREVKLSKDTIYLNEKDPYKLVERYTNEIYNHITLKLDEAGHYESYRKVEKVVGPAIFEEVRYSINPVLSNYILDIYERMLNNSGNLKNKELFINICMIKDINIMKIVHNLIVLFDIYDVFNVYNTYLNTLIKENNPENLLEFYKKILYKNKHLIEIDDNIKFILSRDYYILNHISHKNDDVMLDKVVSDLCFSNGKISEEESINLDIILDENILYKDQDKEKQKENILKKEIK